MIHSLLCDTGRAPGEGEQDGRAACTSEFVLLWGTGNVIEEGGPALFRHWQVVGLVMPRATSDKFTRAPQASAKASFPETSSSSKDVSTAGARHPIFKTEQSGQPILKDPLVAQGESSTRQIRNGPRSRGRSWNREFNGGRILEKAIHVTAVEFDPRIAAKLTKRVQGKPGADTLSITIGDFVKADLPYFDVCIPNTPDQISPPLVFRLLSHHPLPRSGRNYGRDEVCICSRTSTKVDHIMNATS
uniref:rRNA adenine N(6)-methyltransferase n=1 Tax=Mycena chlorophos TaxID=658473 RepID=A0ABQ0M8N4_MYCCL|nr:predicted protein [Mycena chlorophos]